jgi:hypothetical protein
VSDLYFVDKLFKVIRERRAVVSEAITEGSIQDFAAFRHLRGKLEVWSEVEHEIRLLLKREQKDHDDLNSA